MTDAPMDLIRKLDELAASLLQLSRRVRAAAEEVTDRPCARRCWRARQAGSNEQRRWRMPFCAGSGRLTEAEVTVALADGRAGGKPGILTFQRMFRIESPIGVFLILGN